MRLLYSLKHLGERKQLQAEQSLAVAHEHAAVARAKKEEAEHLRLASERLLDEAVVANEHGLTRSALFGKLRTLAITRAHVMESNHRAGVLDTEAAQSRALASEFRNTSIEHRRKSKKIAEWRCRQVRAGSLKSVRMEEREIQEEYACRHR